MTILEYNYRGLCTFIAWILGVLNTGLVLGSQSIDVGTLGAPFFFHSGSLGDAPCLESSDPTYTFQSQAHFQSHENFDSKKLVKEIVVNTSLSAGIAGFIGGRLTLGFLSSNTTTNLQISSLQEFSLESGYQTYTPIGLTDESRKLVQQAANVVLDPNGRTLISVQSKIRSRCGDRLVVQQDLGAQLMLGFKFRFNNREDMVKFRAKLEIWLLFFKIGKSWEGGFTKDDPSFDVELVAHQSGGNPSALQQILKQSKRCRFDNQAPDGNSQVNLGPLQACLQGYQRLLTYAQRDFPQQVVNSPSDLVVLRSHYRRYDQMGFPELQMPEVGGLEFISDRLADLNSQFYIWLGRRQRVEERLIGDNLSADLRARFIEAKASMNEWLSQLNGLMTTCQRAVLFPTNSESRGTCLNGDLDDIGKPYLDTYIRLKIDDFI